MSVPAEQLMVEVRADVRQALSALGTLEAKQATMGSRMGKMAKSMGLAFGGAAVVGGITKTINLAKDFDLTMRQVGVQTDQTGKGLGRLSDLAMKMGKDTQFSAQDAGSAMLELAKGGLTAAQIKAGALKSTLLLASAGGLDLANAAGYTVQALTTFGLKANQANQVAVALAGGANASTASVDSLGQALSQVGPGAKNAGMSLQETVAALAAFDNAGIKGSDAGTSLKTMLTAMVPSTMKAKAAMRAYGIEFVKRNGDFKSMTQVAQELKDGLGDLGEAEKTRALKAIFGSDATRAATVLMENGRKGMRKYINATKDQTAAQDMAKTAMEGAAGAVENFKGTVETAAIQVGRKFLPMVTKILNAGTDFVNDAATWGPKVDESFGWIIDAGKGVLPVLTTVAHLVGGAAKAFDALPDPVKSTAIQIGLAALVLPRLTGAMTAATASAVTGFTTMQAKALQFGSSMTYATLRTQMFGKAAMGAAGIGGMVLLAKGAETGNKAVSAMGKAMTGAFVGGTLGSAIPGVGTAIGAVGGAAVGAAWGLWDMGKAADHVATTSEKARTSTLSFKDSLDQVTGAATKATRAQILQAAQENGILAMTNRLGVNTRDLIGSVLGQEGATRRLTKAYQEHAGALNGNEQVDLSRWLQHNTQEFRSQSAQVRQNHKDLQTWKQALKGLPPKAATEVKAIGVEITERQLKHLKRKYDLTPKQVRTVMAAVGTETVVRKVKGVYQVIKDGAKVKPNLNPFIDTYMAGLNRADTQGKGKTKVIAHGLFLATGKAKANLNPFLATLDMGLTKAKGRAAAGGGQIGSAMSSGVAAGVDASPIINSMVGAVSAGINAAKARAKIKSPSRVMRDEVGKMLGRGVEEGLKARRRHLVESGRALIHDVMEGVRQSWKDAKRTMAQVTKWAHKSLGGRQESAIVRLARRDNDRLEGLHKRREKILDRLDKARAVVADRRQVKADFISSTAAGMTSQANVTNAGNTAGAIASSLTAQVAKVKEFAGLLRTLKKMGYSNRIISEVAAAGVEGGMTAARALAAATKEEQGSIQSSYAAIYGTANDTAKYLGSSMFDAGIHAAEGLVKGLKSKRKDIEQTILDIAMAMQKAIKKALGIKSPSRVMARLGAYAGEGLARGLAGKQAAVRKSAGTLAHAAMPNLSAPTFRNTYAGTTPTYQGVVGATTTSNIHLEFKTYNPVAEPQSHTTNKALARVANLGLV